MRRLISILLLAGLLLSQRASAQLMQTGIGSGGAGGAATPSFLLIDVGSIMLINTGSKLEIHS